MTTTAYRYFETAGAAGAPLLFAFHGTGGNEHQLASLARELAPESHVISPRGDVSEGGALRFFRRTGEGVYDMADLAVRTAAMAGFMAAHRDRLKPSRVVAFGYSNGANILASVMFGGAGLVDDAILMHPLVPFAPPPNPALHQARVLITAGRHDPICPPRTSEALDQYFRSQGSETSLHWHDGGHELRPSEVEAARRFLGR